MFELPRGFVWQAPLNRNGFAVEEVASRAPDSRLESNHVLVPKGVEQRTYRPFEEETGLFLTLAKTPATTEGVLGFANRYGRLGFGHWLPAEDGMSLILGGREDLESLPAWRHSIQWLGALVRLWETVKAGDTRALTKLVRWGGSGVSVDGLSALTPRMMHRGPLIATQALRASGVEKPDVLAAAHVVLAEALTLAMPSGPLSLAWDPARRRVVWAPLSLESLWDAICLQFAAAVEGNKDYQECQGCGRWFELAPGVNRAGRLTCSDSCRQKVFRERRALARRLVDEGVPIREIARRLGSSVDTVSRWVGISKGE
jgi:hypothetical protein